jgi:beta-galactosidase
MKRLIGSLLLIVFAVNCPAQTSQPTLTNRYQSFLFGVAYYPEQWPERMWEEDARRMRECGVGAVRIGEFAWALMEPKEGTFDFSLFDRAIAALAKHNLKIIFGTPTATPPKWLTQKYPEVLYVFADRQPANDQTRRQYNYNSPVYRRLSKRIVTELASHYKDNPHIIGWQIDNEFNNENPEAWSESDRIAFRAWLKEKYQTLDNLNRRWGAVFWSQTYTDWAQIDLPFRSGSFHNPGLMLDYKRFLSDSVESYMQEQIDVLRRYRPRDFVTQNGVFRNINYYKFSRDTDIHSAANYPVFSDNPQYPTGATLTAHRSYLGRFLIMEQQTGAGGQTYLLPSPRPGEMRLWAFQSVAHGADGIIHFRWRSAHRGVEQYWQGVLDHDNVPRSRYEDFKREGAEINKIGEEIFDSKILSDIAVLKDFESQWVFEHQFLTNEFRVPQAYNDLFRAASELKHNLDFISADADFNRHKIIFAPYQILMDEPLAAKMKAFVERGGTLIMSAHGGVKDRDNAFTDQTIPIMSLKDLFGVEVDSYQVLRESNSLKFTDGTSLPMLALAESLKTKNADVVATWERGHLQGVPAATENRLGQGKAVYYGSFFNLDAARYLLSRYAKEQKLIPLFADLPREIEVTRRSKGARHYYFILNHKNEAATAPIGGGFYDLLESREAPASITLSPFGYKILRKAPRVANEQ